jgi:heme-degrading monooxygenase HmoA
MKTLNQEKDMLLERAEMLIKTGLEKEFADAMTKRGIPLLASVPGVNSVKMGQGVENPDKFMLLVEWATMEEHIAFSKSTSLAEFLTVIRPYSRGGSMEHFEMG